jgi:hypothetical protein
MAALRTAGSSPVGWVPVLLNTEALGFPGLHPLPGESVNPILVAVIPMNYHKALVVGQKVI